MNKRICKNCNSKPVYQNHDFCGRSCATAFTAKTNTKSSINTSTCKCCKYFNVAQGFDFCGRSCGQLFNGPDCIGCKKNKKASGFDYCGRTCAVNHSNMRNRCSQCHKFNKFEGFNFCSRTCGKSSSGSSNSSSNGSGTFPMSVKVNQALDEFSRNSKSFNIGKYVSTEVRGGKTFKGVMFYDRNIYAGFYPFCNFYERDIYHNGRKYCCVETAYQADKFTHNKTLFDQFTSTMGGGASSKLAASLKSNIRPEFFKDNYRGKMMYSLVKQKFVNNKDLMGLLKATGKLKLYEITTTDTYWGIGTNGDGENHLGMILEAIRTNC